MHTCGACFNHGFHQFVGIEHTAESGFGIRHNRLHPIHCIVILYMMQLVSAQQCIVDAPDHIGNRVSRIQRLVGVHGSGKVGIRRHLPAGKVNGFQAGLDLLHGLVAGHRTQRVHEWFLGHVPPQFLGAAASQAVFDLYGPTKP